ncbi:MAG TPA: dicarboxylate/amino acid:cation symporter [Planctomycetaceae bacterium]|nr:dicarboxylate/amino acid:cation symporter [Planctomycetaceae bacterium]
MNSKFRLALHWQILLAILLGGGYGFLFPDHVGYVSWLGDLFLRLLQMVVIPLVFCSLVSAITGIRTTGKLGRLGFKAMAMYLLTSMLAILTALTLVNLVRPGVGVDVSLGENIGAMKIEASPLRETLLNIVPKNLFADLAAGNLLPIVVFAILFGVFLARSRDEKNVPSLIDVFDAGFTVMMKLTVFVLAFAPLGVFGILAKNVALFAGESDGIARLGQGLGLHFMVVFSALVLHMFVTLPLCVRWIGKCNPWKHFRNMGAVLLTAFSTASSNGTLPLTLRDVVEKDGVSEETAGFILPLGATVNMDGTSLYECAVVLFVAQAYGIELTFFQQCLTVLMVLLTGIGTAGIPMASLVMIVIVLNAVGLPPEGIGLVLAVDRPLDMCRTAVNVYGDTCCAVVVAKSEGEELAV